MIPGQKICGNCKRRAEKLATNNEAAPKNLPSTSMQKTTYRTEPSLTTASAIDSAAGSAQQAASTAGCSTSAGSTLQAVTRADSVLGAATRPRRVTSHQLQTGRNEESESDSLPSSGDVSVDKHFTTPPESALSTLNQGFAVFNRSPIINRKSLKSETFITGKLEKLQNVVTDKMAKAAFGYAVTDQISKNQNASYFNEMISQLKDAFFKIQAKEKKDQKDREKMLHIISALPKSWSIKRTMEEFGVSKYLVRFVKCLVSDQKTVFPEIMPKKGKRLSQDLVDRVQEFYRDPNNSRELPGKRDCISVKEPSGERVLKQKRLVLGNLKELYKVFVIETAQVENPETEKSHTLSFSKFCLLRPKECVLAGASGTHCVWFVFTTKISNFLSTLLDSRRRVLMEK